MNAVTQELVLNTDQAIAAFDPIAAQLNEIRKQNESIVFDYEDPKENKAARSHVAKLRKSKTAITDLHKQNKQAALEYGRALDAKKNELIKQVEDMIQVHQKPIKEIEEREKRLQEKRAQWLRDIKECGIVTMDQNSDSIRRQMNNLVGLKPTKDELDERYVEAMQEYKLSEQSLIASLDQVVKREEEQAELDRLRKEAEERAQKERDAIIKQEAEEKAKREAEARAQAEQARLIREKEESEQREIKAREDAEKAAEEAAQKAKEQAEREQQEKEDQERMEAEQRQHDLEHKFRVDTAIAKRLVEHAGPLTGNAPQKIIDAINAGKIPNVKIEY